MLANKLAEKNVCLFFLSHIQTKYITTSKFEFIIQFCYNPNYNPNLIQRLYRCLVQRLFSSFLIIIQEWIETWIAMEAKWWFIFKDLKAWSCPGHHGSRRWYKRHRHGTLRAPVCSQPLLFKWDFCLFVFTNICHLFQKYPLVHLLSFPEEKLQNRDLLLPLWQVLLVTCLVGQHLKGQLKKSEQLPSMQSQGDGRWRWSNDLMICSLRWMAISSISVFFFFGQSGKVSSTVPWSFLWFC